MVNAIDVAGNAEEEEDEVLLMWSWLLTTLPVLLFGSEQIHLSFVIL